MTTARSTEQRFSLVHREAPRGTDSDDVDDSKTLRREHRVRLRAGEPGDKITRAMSIEDAPLSAVSNAIRFSAHSTLPWSARSGTSFFRQLRMKQTPKFSSPTARGYSLRFVAASPRIAAAWASKSVGRASRALPRPRPAPQSSASTSAQNRAPLTNWTGLKNESPEISPKLGSSHHYPSCATSTTTTKTSTAA